MTVRIRDIVIDSSDPEKVAAFWCEALGYRVADADDTYVAINGAASAPTMLFFRSSDTKLHKNRIHFDVCPTHGTTRDEEVARLELLGATRTDTGTRESSWVVMADPDDNEFCVMADVIPSEPALFQNL